MISILAIATDSRGMGNRKKDLGRSPPLRSVRQGEVSAVGADNLLRHGKAKAHPVALCGEVGGEDFLE